MQQIFKEMRVQMN